MINLTKLNNIPLIVNVDLIETVECTPDSVITMTNGKKMVVKDSVEEIIEKTIVYKNKILHYPLGGQ